MSVLSEFKEFAMKGNVIDIAVGMVIGLAFGKVVSSFVNDVLMPPIGMMMGGVSFSDLKYIIQEANGELAEIAVSYGLFLQTILDFVIIAFAIFLVVKAINKMKKEQEEEAPAGPSSEDLLVEIRDLLARKK